MRRILVGILVATLVIQGVTNSPAVSADASSLLLTHVHAGVSGGATQEAIALYNPGTEPVDVTDWCLVNKNDVEFVCFNDEQQARYVVPVGGHGVVVSTAHAAAFPADVLPLFVYEPASQSSGSLVGSSDTLVLRDETGAEVDRFAWTKSWASGSVMQRVIANQDPFTYRNLKDGFDWELGLLIDMPQDQFERHEPEVEEQPEQCPEICTSPLPLQITELLPNAEGSDEGAEFIELYNPHEHAVSLDSYSLIIGESSQKTVTLPSGVLEPGEYRAFFNSEVDYTLVNTTGAVRLLDSSGAIVDSSMTYEDPPDDEAWALIGDAWQYTSQPTPGAANEASLLEPLRLPVGATNTLKACAANQYRSPDTNRCRNIPAATTQTPCQEGYVRNAKTNRCRKIVAETGSAPCKVGQERNIETGRCRNVKKLIAVDQGVKAATIEQRPQQWYIVWAVVGLGAVLLAYGAWEWRDELKRVWRKGRPFMIRPK